jgi:hypothetical protein
VNADGMPIEQLDAIERRLDAATPGLWWNDGHEIYIGEPDVPAASMWIGETCNIDLPDNGDANGTFLAHAHQDVPVLVAEVRRLATVLAAEQAAHEDTAATLASYRLLAPQLEQHTAKAQAEAAALAAELATARTRLAELEPPTGPCGHESPHGRRCDQAAGHAAHHQMTGDTGTTHSWMRT